MYYYYSESDILYVIRVIYTHNYKDIAKFYIIRFIYFIFSQHLESDIFIVWLEMNLIMDKFNNGN